MDLIAIDFESFYAKDFSLSKMTTEAYIRDSRFEAIGVSVQVGELSPEWCSGTHAQIKAFLDKFDWANSAAIAHNAMFDMAILNWHFDIRPKRIVDTLSMARAIHGTEVGGSLAALVEHYDIGTKGTEVQNALGKRRIDFTAEELAAYGEYCKSDTALTYKLFHKLAPSFPVSELQLIDMTIRMFSEPVIELNKTQLTKHLVAVRDAKAAVLNKAMIDKDQLMSNPQLAELLKSLGVTPPTKISLTTGKETYAFAKTDEEFLALLEHENMFVQAIVAARLGVKSTIEETRTERFIEVAGRGTLPIPLRYYAAHTGRWGGDDKVNMQNLPRGSALKDAMLAPPGFVFIDCDSSQIECRVLGWLAEQDDLVQAFEKGQDVYKIMASAIYGKPEVDIDKSARFVGKTAVLGCFGPDTKVLTRRGWVGIVEVKTSDTLWDGEEWVTHEGVVQQGVREVITAYGVAATPDHEILTGRGWREWNAVLIEPSLFRSAIAKATSRLPGGATGETGTTPQSGVTVDGRGLSTGTTLRPGAAPGVTLALRKRLLDTIRSIGGTQILSRIPRIGNACSTAFPRVLPAATLGTPTTTAITAAGASQCTSHGVRTDERFYPTSPHCRGGMSPSMSLTGSTTIVAMSRAISGLLLALSTCLTGEPSAPCRQRLMTYDIAYAGPRNRFTVATNAGPVIVHNCGYGLGGAKFKAQLKNFKVDMEQDECDRIIRVYRETYPRIPRLWKQANDALLAMLENKTAPLGREGVLMVDGAKGIRMPNGMYIKYPNLRWRNDPDTGKKEMVYDTKKGTTTVPNRIYGGKVVENCIAEGSLVLTNTGWKPIELIGGADLVHDGVEFVSHGGKVFKSIQACVMVDGVYMTPDHEVLTNEGWKTASQDPKPYRPDLRRADSRESRAQRREEAVLAVSMPVRGTLRQSGRRCDQGDQAGGNPQLRVHDRGADLQGEHNPWHEPPPGLRCMEKHARQMQAAYASGVEELWRAGNTCMQAVAGILRKLLGGHGTYVPAGVGFKPQEQRRAVRAEKLRVDDAPHQLYEQAKYRASGGCATAEQTNWYSAHHAVLPPRARMARRGASQETKLHKPVYDILNAGSRQRFVVLGLNGPFVVHNCTQGLARIIIGEQMIRVNRKFKVVMTVHDAIGCIAPQAQAATGLEFVEMCMRIRPTWAPDLPLNCEGGAAESYGQC